MFRRQEDKANPTQAFAFPKPTRKAKKPKRREYKPARRIAKNIQHAGYLKWVHEQPCVVTGLQRPLYKIDASHLGRAGVGLKSGDINTVPMLHSIHMEWTRHTGRFKGWSKDRRRLIAAEWLARTHARWFALPIEERERYQREALAERAAMRKRTTNQKEKRA